MTHDEFVGEVQNRARLSSRGDAQRAIRATLETFAERLEEGAARTIAAQLPAEIGGYMTGDVAFERLSIDQFFQRVKEREGASVDLPEAVHHARAVIDVMHRAVSEGAIDKVRSTLPAEFAPLFDAGSEGKMNLGQARDRKGNALDPH